VPAHLRLKMVVVVSWSSQPLYLRYPLDNRQILPHCLPADSCEDKNPRPYWGSNPHSLIDWPAAHSLLGISFSAIQLVSKRYTRRYANRKCKLLQKLATQRLTKRLHKPYLTRAQTPSASSPGRLNFVQWRASCHPSGTQNLEGGS
jgi:hypothetical protein